MSPSTLPDPLLWSALALLVGLTLKHYAADFILQTRWIAHGKERAKGWLTPLAVHVLWHGAASLAIALVTVPRLWWLALVDMSVHAAIDRGKSMVGRWGGWDATCAQFWWLIGFDQMLHQLTNIGLATALVLL